MGINLKDAFKRAAGYVKDKVAQGVTAAKNNPATTAAVVAGGLGAKRQADADKTANRAVGYAEGSYKERAPVRQRAIADLTKEREDTSSLFEDRGNVYARRKRAAQQPGR